MLAIFGEILFERGQEFYFGQNMNAYFWIQLNIIITLYNPF